MLLVAENVEVRERLEQLVGLEHEPRVEPVSELLGVRPRDGLEDQDPAGCDCLREGFKQAALQVIELHDDVVVRAGQGFAFEIDPQRIDREAAIERGCLQRVDRNVGDVDGVNLEPEPREVRRVSAVATRDVQRASTARTGQCRAVLGQPFRRRFREGTHSPCRVAAIPSLPRAGRLRRGVAHPNSAPSGLGLVEAAVGFDMVHALGGPLEPADAFH